MGVTLNCNILLPIKNQWINMSSDLKYAQELLEEAKTNTCVPEAVEDLSEVCAIFAKIHGEDSVECAEPFLLYGKALLEMSKIESIVLDNAFEGFNFDGEDEKPDFSQFENPEDLGKDEVGEIDLQVEDAFDINFAEHDRIASIHIGDDIYEEVESEDDSDEEEPEDEDKPDGEDVGHLELAWEVLELARNISGKHGKTDIEAEAFHYLGEVSLEDNNYPQAIEDLSKSLTIKTNVAPAGSRSLAETHYQLGIAYAWSGEWAKAEASLTSAISVLTARFSTHPAEKEGLENIVHEIKGRIADLKDMEKGVFNNAYVTVPGGKISIGGGVGGAVDAAKAAGLPTVGTA